VHAILGNHDCWEDREVQLRRKGPTRAGLALEAAGIPIYENKGIRLAKDGRAFWLVGLGDQWAFWPRRDDNVEFIRGARRAAISAWTIFRARCGR